MGGKKFTERKTCLGSDLGLVLSFLSYLKPNRIELWKLWINNEKNGVNDHICEITKREVLLF